MIVEEKEPSTPTTRRSSLRGRESKDEDDDDEEMEEQESTPTSRSRSRRSAALRRSKNEQNDDAEDEHSDIAHKDDSDSNRPIRRVTRNRLNNSVENEAQDDDDEEEEEVCVEEKRLLRPYPLKGGCVSRSLRFSYALVQPPKRPPSSTFLQPLLLKKKR